MTRTSDQTDPPHPARRGAGFLVWSGALAGLVLAAVRLWLLAGPLEAAGWGGAVPLLLAGLAEDLGLIAGLTLGAALAHRALPRARAAITGTCAVLLAVLLLWGLANIVALRMLGSPVTLDWLAYSDIDSTDVIFDSLRRLFGPREAGLGAVLLGAVFGGAWALARRPGAQARGGAVLALFGAVALAGVALDPSVPSSTRARMETPSLALARSLWQDGGRQGLTRLAEGRTASPDMPFPPATPLARPAPPAKPIRNVILFAFESTPRKHTQGWGATRPVTPNLAARLDRALAFDNAYAHVPASNYYLISVFGGMVPELSTVSMTTSRPEMDLVTLPDVLAHAGLRTAFFNSSDNRFQSAEGFLNAAGFDTVKDYRDWTCAEGVYEVDSIVDKFLNTSNDLCTVGQIIGWIDEAPDRPFFVAFRTGMTHFPYFPGEDPQPFAEDEALNDYLNALHVGDRAFGRLMDHLDRTGLADETLVVVVGDHGEAFGEHGTRVHAAGLHEENVAVPMALINPQLFSGQRSDLIVGIKDLAPTIADLLGVPAAADWQGRSVFDPGRRDGVFFFAPWNGFQVGFRSGPRKFIYNGNSGEAQLYDLAVDPGERQNLAPGDPAAVEEARALLGAAIAAQTAYTDRLLATRDGGAQQAGVDEEGRNEIVVEMTGTRYLTAPKAWVTLDGEHVAVVELTDAPSNATQAVAPEALDAALTSFRLPVAPGPCPRRIGIWFLNDEWDSEGGTGDSDLYIRSVRFGGETYYYHRLKLLTAKAGGMAGDYFRLWRKGEVSLDLSLDRACLAADLGASATR